MASAFANPIEYLEEQLSRIDLLVQLQVLRLRAARALDEDNFRGLYIPDELVDALLSLEERGPAAPEQAGAQALREQLAQAEHSIAEREAETRRQGVELPVDALARRFNLGDFERDVLLLALAPELHLRYQTLYAYVQNDIAKKHLSVDLALNLLCATSDDSLRHRRVFAGDAPLFRHHLLRLLDDMQDREPPLLARYVKADARVVNYLLGEQAVDERVAGFARLAPVRGPALDALELPPGTRAQLEPFAKLPPEHTLLFLHGAYGSGRRTVARALCAAWDLPLLVADLDRALSAACGFETALDLLVRECVLQECALALTGFDALLADEPRAAERAAAVERALAGHAPPAFISAENEWRPHHAWRGARWHSIALQRPDYDARLRLWRAALSEHDLAPSSAGDVEQVAGRFVLTPGQIHDAARAMRQRAALRGDTYARTGDLHAAAMAQSNPTLRTLALKIDPKYAWDDIVLPPDALRQLREVHAAVRGRHVVYEQWGFARKLALSKGVNILFSGPSGTGKTMAAQILARELALDLYKIDLSTLVSKYIGETEKNLGRVFAEAQTSNAILFFDEADALFGKRSEVKDAHDRYANIEVAYLLQRMEDYEGIVILATNLSQNIDDAFKRRMHHTVEFPFPDAERRERIWRGIFPREAPLAGDSDFAFLARQFELSGGNIRNVALTAAFMAAEEGRGEEGKAAGAAIGMRHLILATARELQKIGKLPSRADFQQYYELIREQG